MELRTNIQRNATFAFVVPPHPLKLTRIRTSTPSRMRTGHNRLILHHRHAQSGIGQTGECPCNMGQFGIGRTGECSCNMGQFGIGQTGECPCNMGQFGIGQTGECPCNMGQQTADHILQTCPITYAAARDIVWPSPPTSLEKRLYSSLRDLRATAAFIRETGLDI